MPELLRHSKQKLQRSQAKTNVLIFKLTINNASDKQVHGQQTTRCHSGASLLRKAEEKKMKITTCNLPLTPQVSAQDVA